MKITSPSFEEGMAIPAEFAFAKPDPETNVTFAGNRNPELSWSGAPDGTRSFALICVDPDAPTVADDVNKEGRTVPHDLPRGDFHHWVVVNISADCNHIAAGSCSDGVTPGGKTELAGLGDARQGVQDYTSWFAGQEGMSGTYRGYDGPAPPWNDERIHHYHFQLYALDVDTLDVRDDFEAADVRAAMEGHVLATAQITGTYTQNVNL